MSKCDSSIKEACDIKLKQNESSAVAACSKVMTKFRKAAETCKKSPTNCSCWTDLIKEVALIRKCNIGRLFIIKSIY